MHYVFQSLNPVFNLRLYWLCMQVALFVTSVSSGLLVLELRKKNTLKWILFSFYFLIKSNRFIHFKLINDFIKPLFIYINLFICRNK